MNVFYVVVCRCTWTQKLTATWSLDHKGKWGPRARCWEGILQWGWHPLPDDIATEAQLAQMQSQSETPQMSVRIVAWPLGNMKRTQSSIGNESLGQVCWSLWGRAGFHCPSSLIQFLSSLHHENINPCYTSKRQMENSNMLVCASLVLAALRSERMEAYRIK